MIVMFCGIPGTGKTTIAEIVCQRLTESGQVRMVSSDQLRGAVYRKMLKAIAPDRQRADFVILDATFYKQQWREQVTAVAQDEKVITVYLYCPLAVALERNRRRQPNISEKAIHIVFHKMEPPENPTIRIDTQITSAPDAAATVLNLIKNEGSRAPRSQRKSTSELGTPTTKENYRY